MKPFEKMNSSNTALLIVDVINSCAHADCEIPEWNIHFSAIRKMVDRLEPFIQRFRLVVGGPVIFGKTVPWRKEYLADNVNELYSDEQFAYYSKDTTGFSEQFYKIEPQPQDLIAEKNTNDAFAMANLNEILAERGVRYVVVTGVFTDGCILASVVGGFSKGYSLVVLKDLVETTDVKTRQIIQRHLLEYTFPYLFSRVVSSEDFIKSWK